MLGIDDCNKTSTTCVDNGDGFTCSCRPGFKPEASLNSCEG